MDAKITLSFDQSVIEKAKEFAKANNISLSRLTEFLLSQTTNSNYRSLEDIPVSDWVNTISEGKIEYKTKPKSRKDIKNEYFKSKK